MTDFNGAIAEKWLSAQPWDLQQYLERYAQIQAIGLSLRIIFANQSYADALRCQQERLIKPCGIPRLSVSIAAASSNSQAA